MSVEKDDGVDVGLIAAVEIVVAGSTFESPSTRESSLSDWMAGVVGAAFGTTIGVVASLRAAVGVGVAVRGMGERRRRSGNTGRRRNADTIHFSSASSQALRFSCVNLLTAAPARRQFRPRTKCATLLPRRWPDPTLVFDHS